jgi:hypothetical protein
VLHAYWDRIFGGYSSPFGAVFDADTNDGITGIAVNKTAAQISDPEAWINGSAELAKQFAYAPPVSTGTNAVHIEQPGQSFHIVSMGTSSMIPHAYRGQM